MSKRFLETEEVKDLARNEQAKFFFADDKEEQKEEEENVEDGRGKKGGIADA